MLRLALKNIHPDMYWDYGLALALAGRHKEAEEAFVKSQELRDGRFVRMGALELWLCGKRDEARRLVGALESMVQADRLTRMDATRAYAVMGDKAKALQWLEAAFEKRERQVFWLKIDPRLRSLRGEPRFQELVRKIGLE